MGYYLSNGETYSDAIDSVKEKLADLNKDLKSLKIAQSNLIADLIETFFEYENIFNKDEPKKLIGKWNSIESIKAKMAYCYAVGKSTRSECSISLHYRRKYVSKDEEIKLPYWIVTDSDWYDNMYGNQKPLIFELKHLKTMLESDFNYKKIWLKLVVKKGLDIGYSDWLSEISNNDLLGHLLNTNNKESNPYVIVYIKSVPKLKLKDYVVFLPRY